MQNSENSLITLFSISLCIFLNFVKCGFPSFNSNRDKVLIDIVFITLSEKGAFICDYRCGQVKAIHIPAHLRSISDVSGAGDTVISIATLCLSLGLDIDNIIRYSNMAGGIVCESVGVVPIDKERFYKELEIYN